MNQIWSGQDCTKQREDLPYGPWRYLRGRAMRWRMSIGIVAAMGTSFLCPPTSITSCAKVECEMEKSQEGESLTPEAAKGQLTAPVAANYAQEVKKPVSL